MKINSIIFVIFLLNQIFSRLHNQNEEKPYQDEEPDRSPPKPQNEDDQEDNEGASELEDFEDTLISNNKQASCSGKCMEIPIDLTGDGSWVQGEPVDGWTSSHGTPSVGSNVIWMWSYNNRGEGVNLEYNFAKDQKYCMETVITTKVQNNQVPNPAATANIILTPTRQASSPLSSTTIPSTPSPNMTVWSEPFSTLPSGGTATYVNNFVPQNNFNNVWFYPRSPQLPQVEMVLRRVRICQVNPCDQVKINIKHKTQCSVVQFYSIVDSYGGDIIGQTWHFGDNNYSNEVNPTHNYDSSGSYIVQLTVLIKFDDGECCTKTIEYKIGVEECDPCKQVGMAQVTWYKQGGQVIFHPTIPHNNYYYYQWTFSDSTSFTTREVSKPVYSTLWASLTIHHVDPQNNQGKCCERAIEFKYKGKLQVEPIELSEPFKTKEF